MLFLQESGYFYGAGEVSVEEALAEQLLAVEAQGQLQIALLEADYTFHTQVLTESEKEGSESGVEKKAGFLQRVIAAIKTVIAKIIAAVRKLIAAIAGVFTGNKDSKEKEVEEKAKKAKVSKNDMHMVVKKDWLKMVVHSAEVLKKYLDKVGSVSTIDAATAMKSELEKAMDSLKKDLDKAREKAGDKDTHVAYGEWESSMNKLSSMRAAAAQLENNLKEQEKALNAHEQQLKSLSEKKQDAEKLGEVSRQIQVVRLKISLYSTLNGRFAQTLSHIKSLSSVPVVPPKEDASAATTN